jgi:WD40 repeat protein
MRAVIVLAAVLVLMGVTLTIIFEPDGKTEGNGAETSPRPSTSPAPSTPARPTKSTDPPAAVQTQQPSATFACNDTDNAVTSVSVRPGGDLLACSNTWAASIWNLKSGSPSPVKDLPGGALAVAFAPDGNTLLTAGDSCWQLFEGGRPWNEIGDSECGPDRPAAEVAFAPDGKTFASRSSALDDKIRFWAVANHLLKNTYTAADGRDVRSIAYSPKGRYVASGSADAHAYLWDTSTGRSTALKDDSDGHTDAVNAVGFSPDGKRLVSGSDDRTAKLWSVPDGKLLASLTGEHDGAVTTVAFSPDGRTVATGGDDHKVVIWDVATGKPVRRLEGSGGAITSLSFDGAGKILAGGCSDDKVVIWSLTP